MKRKLLILLPIFGLSLTGCQFKHESAIAKINVIAEASQFPASFEISYEHMIDMLESKNSFIVLFHTDGCHLCDSAQTILSTYIKNNDCLIYDVEVNTSVQTKLDSYFGDKISSYPNMVVFSEGKLTYQFDQNNLIIQKGFENEINKLLKGSSIYFGIEKISINSFVSKQKNVLLAVYDSSDRNSYKFIYDNLKSKAENSSKITVLVDEYFAKDKYLTVTNDTSTYNFSNLIVEYEDGSIQKTTEIYSDGSNINQAIEIINSYY